MLNYQTFYELNNKTGSNFKLLKTHRLSNEFYKKISKNDVMFLFTFRDIRDVLASMINKFGGDVNTYIKNNFISQYLDNFYLAKRFYQKTYISKYEEYFFKIDLEIENISRFLNIDLPKHKISDIAKELDINNVKTELKNKFFKVGKKLSYDEETLFHPNHIFSGKIGIFKSQLNLEEIAYVESECMAWLIENKYEISKY